MQVAKRFAPFAQTIFTEITNLANEHGAINLGQGFPNFDGPGFIKQAAAAAMDAGHNQYARMWGVPLLNEAIAAKYAAAGIPADPDANITVTAGCTEALAATFLGLVNPGDEVILIEPYYDSYPACVAIAGAVPRYVTLRAPDFALPEAELRAAFSDRTRAIVVNTPHNPTGRVLSLQELGLIAELCVAHDTIAIADEVYEHMVYEGEHRSLATLPGMADLTVTLSSLGKTFSLTGWKIGWAVAAPDLTAAIRKAHQFLIFAVAAPLQHGAAAALGAPPSYYEDLTAAYRSRRDLLCEGLDSAGLDVFVPEGTYFVLADHSAFGFEDDVAFVRHLITEIGVAAIPPSAFYSNKSEGASLVRFAFCKDEATLKEAVDRLGSLRR